MRPSERCSTRWRGRCASTRPSRAPAATSRTPAPPATARRRAAQRVRPGVQRLLDSMDPSPAFVLGRRMDVLAGTPSGLAPGLRGAPSGANMLRSVFLDAAVQALYPNWAGGRPRRSPICALAVGADPDDPRAHRARRRALAASERVPPAVGAPRRAGEDPRPQADPPSAGRPARAGVRDAGAARSRSGARDLHGGRRARRRRPSRCWRALRPRRRPDPTASPRRARTRSTVGAARGCA